MAFPVIEATETSTGSGDSPSFSLPAGIVTDELLIASFGWRGSGAPVSISTSGWTELTRNATDSGNTGNVIIAYRKADGTEGSSLAFSLDGADESTCAISRVSGWDTTTAPLGSAAGSGTSKTTNPDPPSRSFGWTTDTLSIIGHIQRDSENITVVPTGYSEVADFDNAGKSRNRSDQKNVTSSPENPSAYTLASDQESSWYTVVIPSAAAASGGTVGVWTGSAFVQKPVKVWTGSAFETKPLKRWNGSAFV
jgi:hypothetical protein